MRLVESILTNNPCYTAGRKIAVQGLMLHSVGCAQPKASVFINSWNKASFGSACVHGFIDGNDGTVYQTLPWNHRGWHAGSGINGSANNTHIGVEMCEPACIKYTGGANLTCSDMKKAKAVAKRTYGAAVELFAMLCLKYSLDPLKDGVVISHAEGHKRGIASNHGDPEHLWRQLGMDYTMDGFRRDVKAAMSGGADASDSSDGTMTEKELYEFFRAQGLNDYGVSGLLGNLFSESGLRANNLQNSYEKKLNIRDEEYTRLVDGGNYPDFVKDKAGYGLAQWTFWSRKQALLDYAKAKGVSIGDARMQCEFLMKELTESYPAVLTVLKSASSVREASDAVLLWYERPADTSVAVQAKRAGFGQGYYEKYAGESGGGVASSGGMTNADCPFMVKVTATDLNIRRGAGTNTAKTGKYTGAGVFTIVEVKSGKGSDKGWGKLKSGAGWIALDHCQRV